MALAASAANQQPHCLILRCFAERAAASLFSSNTNRTFANTANRFAYNESNGDLYYDAQGNTPRPNTRI